ncbi:MAG: hypothetical protein SOV90_02380 [Lachnospiraceae bacterium]|nr:hypothetical protein [Lachnospiraceae bacterium]
MENVASDILYSSISVSFLPSRIEAVSKGGQILISKESIKDIEKKVAVREEMTVTVKGISKEVTVCEVMWIKQSILLMNVEALSASQSV